MVELLHTVVAPPAVGSPGWPVDFAGLAIFEGHVMPLDREIDEFWDFDLALVGLVRGIRDFTLMGMSSH